MAADEWQAQTATPAVFAAAPTNYRALRHVALARATLLLDLGVDLKQKPGHVRAGS